MHFLEKHPVPWKIVEFHQPTKPREEGPIAVDAWQVQDAKGEPVILTCTPSDSVSELVDFTNCIGSVLPRLINFDLQEKVRRKFDRQWKTRELTEDDKQRIIEMSKKSRFRTPQIFPKAGQILGLFDDKG